MRILAEVAFMAVDALELAMGRVPELPAIDVQIDQVAGARVAIGQGLHAMTAQTVGVVGAQVALDGGLGLRYRSRQQAQQQQAQGEQAAESGREILIVHE
jgi:hypothetical protein